jgi:hypothetical protein
VTLTGPEDLDALDENRLPGALRVEPRPVALRDAAFLRRVGTWASRHRVPIVFVGSALGHAFHLLGQDGAVVVQPDRDDIIRQPEDVDWRVVVVAYSRGLERVRVLPRGFVQFLAAMTLARLAATAATGPHVARALAALMDRERSARRGGASFDELGRVEVDAAPEALAPGAVPLFMDEGPSGKPSDAERAHPLTAVSIELPIAEAYSLPLHLDVPGARVSVSSSRPGSAIVTVTPRPA